MTQERFLKLLDDPDRLASISYQELKTLALAYPFAASLRVLLLLKSHYEGHADKLQNLSTASIYVPDRARLFQLMAPRVAIVRTNDYDEQEVFLELKPIAEAEKDLLTRAALEIQQEKKSAPQAVGFVAEPPVPPIFSKKEPASSTPFFSEPSFEKVIFEKAKTPEKGGENLDEKAASVVSIQNLATADAAFFPKKETTKTATQIVEKALFEAWAAQFLLPALKAKKAKITVAPAIFVPKSVEKRIEKAEKAEKPTAEKVEAIQKTATEKAEIKKPKPESPAEIPAKTATQNPKTEVPIPQSALSAEVSTKAEIANPKSESRSRQPSLFDELEAKHASKQDPVRQIAEQSVSEKREIVSETLAKVYARQGYREKALDMYERLMLAFPEKKLTFAAEIEKLRPTA